MRARRPAQRTAVVPAGPWQAPECIKGAGEGHPAVGKEKQEVKLRPVADKLEAKGSFKVGVGTKAVAVVSHNGGTMGPARFTLK